MARRHIESWIYWIVVDVIGIWLYFAKDVRFISLLYVVLLVIAIRGLIDWRRARGRSSGEGSARTLRVTLSNSSGSCQGGHDLATGDSRQDAHTATSTTSSWLPLSVRPQFVLAQIDVVIPRYAVASWIHVHRLE